MRAVAARVEVANLSGPALETTFGAVQLGVAPRAFEHLCSLLLQVADLLGDRIELGACDCGDQRVGRLDLFRGAHQVERCRKTAQRIGRAALRSNIRAVLVAIALPVFVHRGSTRSRACVCDNEPTMCAFQAIR